MGINSKSVAAKERKNEKAAAEKAAKDAALEDAKWRDDGNPLAKKQAKKDEAEKRRLEVLAKKKEREEMLQQENADIASKQAKTNPIKVTRAQIADLNEKRENIALGKDSKQEPVTHLTVPLEENVNRLAVDGVEARNIDEAIGALRVSEGPAVDKHPEKRMKAAYEDFENVRLPQLKSENPSMRLSQLKQMLRKEWQKHPDNPLNKAMAAAAAASRN